MFILAKDLILKFLRISRVIERIGIYKFLFHSYFLFKLNENSFGNWNEISIFIMELLFSNGNLYNTNFKAEKKYLFVNCFLFHENSYISLFKTLY